MKKLRTIEIPQADSLPLVRQIVEAVGNGPDQPVKALAATTKVQERHVRYRLATARTLGYVTPEEDGTAITPAGTQLLATTPNSPEEKAELRRAIAASLVVKQIAPNLFTGKTVDVGQIARRIMRSSDLSQATADRRAVVLRAWHRHLTRED